MGAVFATVGAGDAGAATGGAVGEAAGDAFVIRGAGADAAASSAGPVAEGCESFVAAGATGLEPRAFAVRLSVAARRSFALRARCRLTAANANSVQATPISAGINQALCCGAGAGWAGRNASPSTGEWAGFSAFWCACFRASLIRLMRVCFLRARGWRGPPWRNRSAAVAARILPAAICRTAR